MPETFHERRGCNGEEGRCRLRRAKQPRQRLRRRHEAEREQAAPQEREAVQRVTLPYQIRSGLEPDDRSIEPKSPMISAMENNQGESDGDAELVRSEQPRKDESPQERTDHLSEGGMSS